MTPSRIDISKKYALAYIQVFDEFLDETILDKFKVAYEFLSKNTNMLFLLSSYDLAQEEKQKIATTFVHFFSFHQSMHKLINLLLEKKHICFLAEILRDAYCCYKKNKNIEDLVITSSSIISQKDQEELKQFFMNLSDKKYRVTLKQNADLIAGIRMQSDTFLWEYSVAKKMKKLRFDLLKKV